MNEVANQRLTLSAIYEYLIGLSEEMSKTRTVSLDVLTTLVGSLPPEPCTKEELKRDQPKGALDQMYARVQDMRQMHNDISSHIMDIQSLIGR